MFFAASSAVLNASTAAALCSPGFVPAMKFAASHSAISAANSSAAVGRSTNWNVEPLSAPPVQYASRPPRSFILAELLPFWLMKILFTPPKNVLALTSQSVLLPSGSDASFIITGYTLPPSSVPAMSVADESIIPSPAT